MSRFVYRVIHSLSKDENWLVLFSSSNSSSTAPDLFPICFLFLEKTLQKHISHQLCPFCCLILPTKKWVVLLQNLKNGFGYSAVILVAMQPFSPNIATTVICFELKIKSK